MRYFLKNHDRKNAVQDLLICLFPEEEHVLHQNEEAEGDFCLSALESLGEGLVATAMVRKNGKESYGRCPVLGSHGGGEEGKRAASYAIKTALYKAATQHLNTPPLWGSLTGVKPAKAIRPYLEGGMDKRAASSFLQEKYFCTPSRADLCVEAAQSAIDVKRSLHEKEVQLYVGIPFCPQRCSYCSFVSIDTQKSGHLIEPYLEVLGAEISAAAEMLTRQGLFAGSLYIGGGTPTVLTAAQLEWLISRLKADFDLSKCREFTIEAGRVETIDEEKLALFARENVGRISINPQTMNDEVLKGVNRLHTAEDVKRVYFLARKTGNFIINMDLIAGLPGDCDESLINSVTEIARLNPENITIHSLALKNGAALRFGKMGVLHGETLDKCYEILGQKGYRPYYLYRQKYIAGGLENVGFERDNTPSLYNIAMMEELSSVLALGAGGVSKLVFQEGQKIVRLANPKYPREYIETGGEIARKKLNLVY